MSEKPVTLEDLARAEAALQQKRASQKQTYLEGQKKLEALMPERFFQMARQLRDGVTRYNGAARLERNLAYSETTAVTTKDRSRVADFVCEVRRDPDYLVVALRTLWRLHADDAYVIEVEGLLGREPSVDRVRLRVQGVWKGEELDWRITNEGQKVDTSIDDLPDRVVAAVATSEVTRLWTTAPFVEMAAPRRG